jgi:hypothetical protein
MNKKARFYVVCCKCSAKFFSRSKHAKCPREPDHQVLREKIQRVPPWRKRR